MVKRNTLFLLVVLIVVAAVFSFIYKPSGLNPDQDAATATNTQYLISFSSEEILDEILIVDWNSNKFKMTRSSTGEWYIYEPSIGKADQSLASAAETQAYSLRIITILENPPHMVELGLEVPLYRINFHFTNNHNETFTFGLESPSGSGYYARDKDGTISLVSKPGLDALISLIKNPPFLPTNTPALFIESPASATP